MSTMRGARSDAGSVPPPTRGSAPPLISPGILAFKLLAKPGIAEVSQGSPQVWIGTLRYRALKASGHPSQRLSGASSMPGGGWERPRRGAAIQCPAPANGGTFRRLARRVWPRAISAQRRIAALLARLAERREMPPGAGRLTAGVGDDGRERVPHAGVVAAPVQGAEGGVQLVGLARRQVRRAADAEADEVGGHGRTDVRQGLERPRDAALLGRQRRQRVPPGHQVRPAAPAASIRPSTRCGESGISRTSTPSGRRASSTALAIAAGGEIAPPSPRP